MRLGDRVPKANTISDNTAKDAGSANQDIMVAPVAPALSPKPINIGAITVPMRPTLFAQPMPVARRCSG